MTRGKELPVNSTVRRRLFSEDEQAPSSPDGNDHHDGTVKPHVLNTLQNERIVKAMKWNFDFTSETALEGPIEWFKKSNDEWVGIKASSPINIIQDMINEVEFKAVSEDERSQGGELPRHIVLQRQALADREALEDAIEEACEDNETNKIEEQASNVRRSIKEASDFLKEYTKAMKQSNRMFNNSMKQFTNIRKMMRKDYPAAMKLHEEGNESDDDSEESEEEQTDIKDANEATPSSSKNLKARDWVRFRQKKKRFANRTQFKEMNKKRRLLL